MYQVYFIQQVRSKRGEQMPVKIGHSSDVDRRLDNLQTGSPIKLKKRLSLSFETKKEAALVEKCMHSLAKSKHKALRGEWFVIYGDWKKFIAQSLKMVDGINPSK